MTFKQPLADLMRPNTLDEMIGQEHLLTPGKPLYQIIKNHVSISLLLWGPPGCGKTTLAHVMANTLKIPFEKFNASIQNKSQLQALVRKHPEESFVLLLDEIHRLTKPIQDYLLPYLENGHILLVGTTTENPIMAIQPAIRSRCQIFEFKPIAPKDVEPVLIKAANEHLDFSLSKEQAHAIANCGNGDVRVSLNILDTLHAMCLDKLTMDDIADFARNQHFSYDKDATQHYDYISAFSNSIEGSDADAALYYLAVILQSGDLASVVRRLKDSAALDVGLADPEKVNQVINLCNTALEIGLPRASTHVAMATIMLAIAPKSDSVMQAYYQASKDAVHPNQHPMPDYLRDCSYQGSDKLRGAGIMKDMFKEPHHIAKQAYMPADLIGKHYYEGGPNRNEEKLYAQYQALFKYIYDQPFVKSKLKKVSMFKEKNE
ncbi:replication-associated recombination protein A [Lactobacillus ultunensis]|uniref:Recombination factor protein RarA n=1 Tax=Lactobacillus ultunensis DSM 16047 TaxID=525365 RepID=C2ENF7_9LACO|nr:replication-associated recombination protein A [Lactobacillus ultunensis]EEJ71961.1 recombination factor protein RarA [Lactobacillus ultunensis DSM 16047]KRL82012.1 crossover junction endodeoxyribonuclease ATPase [Lactobacillus ultunensis DSM 16047]QQP27636.1 replication-associated recombination protein A [Lactobacillus ultunensis]